MSEILILIYSGRKWLPKDNKIAQVENQNLELLKDIQRMKTEKSNLERKLIKLEEKNQELLKAPKGEVENKIQESKMAFEARERALLVREN